MRKRLRSAYLYGLSLLEEPYAFDDDPDARAEFERIAKDMTSWAEAREGGGTLETTLGLMTEDAAHSLGARIVGLAERYGQA
jgi:hypothetical protein